MAEKTKPIKLSSKKVNPSKFVELNPTMDASKKSTAVLTMGDFSPPTMSDHRLVESATKYANLHEGDVLVFVVKGGISEGYLDERQRIYLSQSVFGNVVYQEAVEDLVEALSIASNRYDNAIVVVPNTNLSEAYTAAKKADVSTSLKSIRVVEYSDPKPFDIISEHILNRDYLQFKREISYKLRPIAEQIFQDLAMTEQLDENIRPLSYAERIKRAQTMKRYAKRMEIARERAEMRRASPEKIRERARKKALEIIRARILHNKEYSELSHAEKNAVDTKLMGIPSAVIERIARRLVPAIKRAEAEKFHRKHHHYTSLSASATGHHKHINESFEELFDIALAEARSEDHTISDLFALIEAVETSHLDRARSAIKNEKKSDAIKHQKMITTAKHADINRAAAAKFTELQNESSEVIRGIIAKELERKKLIAAAHEFSNTPDLPYMPKSEKEAKAKSIIDKMGIKEYDYNDILRLYKTSSGGKVLTQKFNTTDVIESLDPEDSTPDEREWGTDSLTDIYKRETPGQYVEEKYKPKGLWHNIRMRRKKGLRRLRPGEKGYPETLDIEDKKK